ncbi:META domain-containing protein [Rubrimonas cliftonensis]|uniref:Uncharacterized lipoprotein YbaY n=1 Tax=Rubrimonas cliftonensis TaxID=89524 RepID=A0A1H4AEL2_9RHOB|nr:META domain-containing protein [Rubrimonas cliftonensis]SEA34337.1 Uncharacterized lipoprotein YbaY [Rubrimonas cliftonensis]
MSIAAAAAILAVAAFGAVSGAAAGPVLTGEATFRERIMPPPGARFTATLSDVSRADAPSVELGRFEIEDAGAPPYRFAIPYDPAAVSARGRYAVRATLHAPGSVGERLMFTTDSHHPAFGPEAEPALRIVMVRVAEHAAPLRMVGALWRLTALGGEAFAPGEAHVVLDAEGRIAGSGGCNRLGGQAIARDDGAFLAGRLISTMRACPEPAMRRERALFDALEAARGWRIEGDALTLSDASGAPLARFRADPS